jgi:hypothetical protein
MVIKEFIPCEQARELKELGFYDDCLGYYYTDPNAATIPVLCIYKPYKNEFCLPAPIYQQAFRFFREKYDLICQINYIGGLINKTTWWDIAIIGHYNIDPKEWEMKYQPYEEAELACLKKLIEIVKNK